MSKNLNDNHEEIFSRVLRAGRRTYFFDVRETKASDYYLTVTESKKFTNEDDSFYYKKHKIYLYKEDFHEFKENLEQMIDYVIKEKGEEVISERHRSDYTKQEDKPAQISEETNTSEEQPTKTNFTDLDFDDI